MQFTLYFNTKFHKRESSKDFFVQSPTIKRLKSAGCLINLMPSVRMLHDKLIIVDNRFIVEGSTNWSIKGLRRNFESSTLIDSPGLAKIKLSRLKELIKFTKSEGDSTYTPYYVKNLPKTLSTPDKLLLNRQYLPRMVSKQDKRAFDLYLLLLAHSQLTKKDKFFLNLEDMGLSLGLPKKLHRHCLKAAGNKKPRKLKLRYNLIDVDFYCGKNAFVSLCYAEKQSDEGSSTTFTIPTDSITNNKAPATTHSKFLLLVSAFVKTGGEDIESLTNRELRRRFGVSEVVFRQARKELH